LEDTAFAGPAASFPLTFDPCSRGESRMAERVGPQRATTSSGPASQPHGLHGSRPQNIEYARATDHRIRPQTTTVERHESRLPVDDATTDRDLRSPPSNHFEKLRGHLDGFHSIRVNKRWRLVFRWNSGRGEAKDLYLDDHSYV
jgi:proteic killer suppression protein